MIVKAVHYSPPAPSAPSARLVPTDPETLAVAAEARCPDCLRVGQTATTWRTTVGEIEEWFACPNCYHSYLV